MSSQAWQVGTVEGAGRGLFASRDIKAGEEVLRDWPVVEGPLPDGGDSVCVMCLKVSEVTACSLCSRRVCEELARTLIKLDGVNSVDVLRLIAQAGNCKRLESQQEQAAFHMRISTMMMG